MGENPLRKLMLANTPPALFGGTGQKNSVNNKNNSFNLVKILSDDCTANEDAFVSETGSGAGSNSAPYYMDDKSISLMLKDYSECLSDDSGEPPKGLGWDFGCGSN